MFFLVYIINLFQEQREKKQKKIENITLRSSGMSDFPRPFILRSWRFGIGTELLGRHFLGGPCLAVKRQMVLIGLTYQELQRGVVWLVYLKASKRHPFEPPGK